MREAITLWQRGSFSGDYRTADFDEADADAACSDT